MATVQASRGSRKKPKGIPPPPPGQVFRLSYVDWPTFVAISDAMGPRHVRMSYADGEMEWMALSRKLERGKTRLARLVEALTEELDIEAEGAGSMTFRREDLVRGLEPDECYWIEHEPHMRDRDEFDPLRDPPPDLALEIEVSRTALDRMEIYAKLKVPEVWRWDGKRMRFCWLVRGRRYEETATSRAFPQLRAVDLQRFMIVQPGVSQAKTLQLFRRWVREQIVQGW